MDTKVPIQAVERVSSVAVDTSGLPLESHLPIDYNERFRAITVKADFTDTMFSHVANGQTLISLAEIWGVRHSDLVNYVNSNPWLKDHYAMARVARDEWEKERLIQELRAIATVDIRQAYNPDGSLKAMKDMPADVASAISSVESEELFAGTGSDRELVGYTKKVKFWDKAKAIETFLKKHGMLVDRHQVAVGRTLEELVSAANDDNVSTLPANVEVVDIQPDRVPALSEIADNAFAKPTSTENPPTTNP